LKELCHLAGKLFNNTEVNIKTGGQGEIIKCGDEAKFYKWCKVFTFHRFE